MTSNGDKPLEEERPQNLVLIVGQLLEATKAAADGVKSLSSDTRQNTIAIIKAAQTLELTEKLVLEINSIVRTGTASSPSLLAAITLHSRELEEVNVKLRQIVSDVEDGETRLNALDRSQQQAVGATTVIWYVVIALFQLVTLGVAIYAISK